MPACWAGIKICGNMELRDAEHISLASLTLYVVCRLCMR
jgi:hypothetical protein